MHESSITNSIESPKSNLPTSSINSIPNTSSKSVFNKSSIDKTPVWLKKFEELKNEQLEVRLIDFVNIFKENVSIIKSVGVNDLAGFLLFHMGSRVLDSTTLQLFESSISQSTIPDFDQLLNFVQQRCKILENLKSVNKIDCVDKFRSKPFAHRKSAVPTKSVFTTIASTSNKSFSKNCCFCDHSDHNIYRCPKFNELSVEKRRDFVVSRKLCFACLSPKHMVKSCLSKSVCRSTVKIIILYCISLALSRRLRKPSRMPSQRRLRVQFVPIVLSY